jgi:lysylphosphatidylglycerol synthetase-like protein (DUF2156 family)
MIHILSAFYALIFLFGIIGAGRGWAKELLVIFSMLVALALIAIFEHVIPITNELLVPGSMVQFWFRTLVLIILVVFGYQTPKISRFAPASGRKDTIQETMLGFVMGMFNGFMIIGSLWYFMHYTNYPFESFAIAPNGNTEIGQTALDIANKYLPPSMMIFQHPWVYVAVIFSFVFVLVVFL